MLGRERYWLVISPLKRQAQKKLTTSLFRRQASAPDLSRAAALQQAALQLIDEVFSNPETGAPLFSYAHPIFWELYT